MREVRLSGRLIGAASLCVLSVAILYDALSPATHTEQADFPARAATIPYPVENELPGWIDHFPEGIPCSYLADVEEPVFETTAGDRDYTDRGGRGIYSGIASWYGGSDGFDGSITASGEVFDASAYTAAHPTLPFGTKVRVTYRKTGLSIVVRINDRGPFVPGRIIDLSRAAAAHIGLENHGIGIVDLEILE